MSKYCCFFCPAKDYSEKSLEDKCPACGRHYGFVLDQRPERIGDYRITKDLGRGFYGAAYVAERGKYKKVVIKISPVDFYTFFKKPPFEEETDLHAQLAQSAEHVVGIEDSMDANVVFSDADGSTLRCHVTVLDFVNGDLLRDYIDGKIAFGAATACQIAVDLLRIRSEFEAHRLNHNDLHAENLIIERLPPQATRVDGIDPTIRVKAIDLGSVADSSKSDDSRLGDLLHIAHHVDQLLERLLAQPEALDDRDFRIALALQGIVHGLQSGVQNMRLPNFDDLAAQIRDAFYHASQPWRPWIAPLKLRGFADHYNAQTLVSWDVPRLLVDPHDRWLAEVSKPGPQIITGMRGCGKTMLLRALDIHARAAKLGDETDAQIVERIRKDGFVGLFVSAQRLLDLRHSTAKVEHRLTRLFVHYALEAARALLHLRDVDRTVIAPAAHTTLASVTAEFLDGADELHTTTSLEDLERKLERIAVISSRAGSTYEVKHAPAIVFPRLAEQFRNCTSLTAISSVFFLLDDVSTRYLELDRIEELLSALLFQSPSCAFKFTSEWQTIELGLRSPGRNHPIRVDRDLSVFDLGADVFDTINGSGPGKGVEFVEQILLQRSRFHAGHPNTTPRELLGYVPLEQVAREIAASSETSRSRKEAYRGLACLTNVCVGDIGDVIKLYEEILKRAGVGRGMSVPVAESIQADCFQSISSRRLYDLNRRGGLYKNHALAFAEAAHDLLVRSHKEAEKKAASKGGKRAPTRLRQYSSIYVRVSADNPDSVNQQIDLLRDLIDAGVFVYTGGAPRAKTKDSNPMQQFKLSYRKIYGLAAFIGLADRDRFELSGSDLERWLTTADKNILLSNQVRTPDKGASPTAQQESAEPVERKSGLAASVPVAQFQLFSEGPKQEAVSLPVPKPIDVSTREISLSELASLPIEAVVTGLGFEDRTLASNQALSKHTAPKAVHAVRYDVAGHSEEIGEVWRRTGSKLTEVQYSTALRKPPRTDGLTLVDISGLSKPLIFKTIRRELQEKGRVIVFHMLAQQYYPLEDTLGELFQAADAGSPIDLLNSLSNVLKGEEGPYRELGLLDEEVDLSRTRALVAFASAKHERLFSLLEKREFDYVNVIAPAGDLPRARVANYAAEFLCQNYQNATVTPLPQKLDEVLSYLDRQYLDLYGQSGANVEFGLTGSKIQAVAVAVLSARRKVAQAWYLSPAKFDEARFSTGVGQAHIYDISVVR